jgi:2-keto-4-pentenoate hydratase/2-oxohepta-3-ene-1,7-dioic acid hydratase in catechol pathway
VLVLRLGTLRSPEGPRPVAVVEDEVVDLTVAARDLPPDIVGLLAMGEAGLKRVAAAVESGRGREPLDRTRLDSPVGRPPKFFAVGLNYADHVAESGQPTPEFPTVFSKMPSCVVGPFDDVQRPAVSDQLDYEGELGFVIGRRCRHVPRDHAHEVIAGYVVVNDYSVRDYQMRVSQWLLGKSFDTHGVIGPWIAMGDELDPHRLDIRTWVNGELRQSSNTEQLIFDCFDQVALLSTVCTLEPGDVVATGTPGGVGFASGQFLRPGDVVRVEIEGIGTIENRIVQEDGP